MTDSVPRTPLAERTPLSGLLAGLRLSGLNWSYADLGANGGFSVSPGDAVLAHTVIHGEVRLTGSSSAATTILRAGDTVFVLSGEAHALRTAADANCEAHPALRDGAGPVDVPTASRFGARGTLRARVLSGRLAATWPGELHRAALPDLMRADTSLFAPTAMALAGIGAGSATLLTRLAEALLVATLRRHPGCRRLLAGEERDPVRQALQLIAADPAQAWTVEGLARAVGMGRSSFAAQFARQAGQSPMEAVAQERMARAARLLRGSRMKVAEIAEITGYGSEAAFSRRFSRHFGMPPSRLRDEAHARRQEAQATVPDQPAAARSLLPGTPRQPGTLPGRPRADTGASRPALDGVCGTTPAR